MAVAIAASKLVTASATTATATFDAAHAAAAGSLLLAQLSYAGTTDPSTPPSGYTLLRTKDTSNGNKAIWIYGKVAAGGETNVSATWAVSARLQISFIEVTGVDASGIVAGTTSIQGASTANTANATTLTAGSVDPTATTEVLMLAHYVLGGTPGSNPTWDGTYSYATLNDPSAITGCRSFTGWKIATNLGAQVPVATWTSSVQSLSTHYVITASAGAGVQVIPPDLLEEC